MQGPLASGAGPFAARTWYELLEKSGRDACFATVTDANGAFALPFDAAFQPLTNWYAFTWQPLSGNPAPADDAITDLARDLGQRTKRLDFAKLETPTADLLQHHFRRAGWLVFREESDTNHILRPAGRSYAEYLASRPGQLRTTLKRKAKKLEVALSTRFDPDEWSLFEDIYRDSWKPAEGDPEFLRFFALQQSDQGHFLFGIARHDGMPVAAQFWTVEDGTAYIHKLAHREDATKLSPGSVLTAALFEHAIDVARVGLVDFGTGDDPYKRDWMEEQRPRYTLTCLRPAYPRNWPAILRRLVSRTRPR